MKKLISLCLVLVLSISLIGCSNKAPKETEAGTQPVAPTEAETQKTEAPETEAPKKIEPFGIEYEVKGSSYTGPFCDTYIFEGETTDGIITSLNFDVIRDKGTEKEYSKKNIMGYVMNISDAKIEKAGDALKLTLSCNGYDTKFGEGNNAQFMLSASTENLTPETTFKELGFFSVSAQAPITVDQAIIAYQYLATENGIETLTGDTLVKDLIAKHELFDGTNFKEGANRVSFAGFNGGRSYGEQLDAITAYILASEMTLEDVYQMFKNENQQSTPIEDRDVIAGATISFTGDFQKMVYLAINGALPEGVVADTVNGDMLDVTVVTQGFGGEITTVVTFDAENKIAAITVKSASETDGIGAVLTAENSEFIQALLAGQNDIDKVDAVSGATVTSEALRNAVEYALAFVAQK